jgi:gamma-glutamylcyclotransferase (GGCT)/AIG2-like uncharacterized protein YtfP
MNPRNQRVFVYGTLKRGKYFHPAYLHDKSDFIGTGVASSDYAMYIDGLPHMVRETNHDFPVKGELFLVDQVTLDELDALEGHPLVYKRELIDVYDESGERVLAWAYLRQMSFKGKNAWKESEF